MNHTAGIAPAIRQLYLQRDCRRSKPIVHADGSTLATTGPGAGKTPSAAYRCGNIPAPGKAKPSELAPAAMPNMIRRPPRLEVRLRQ